MFVFPANDDGYRKRKRVHKACEQCKRRRKRCNFPLGSVRCEPCTKADILCSLAPEYELPEKDERLDDLAKQNFSFINQNTNANTTQDISQVGVNGYSPENSSIFGNGCSSNGRSTPVSTTSSLASVLRPTLRPTLARASSHNSIPIFSSSGNDEEEPIASNLRRKKESSHSPPTLTRPTLGSRATSFNLAYTRQKSSSPIGNLHKRTNSHGPVPPRMGHQLPLDLGLPSIFKSNSNTAGSATSIGPGETMDREVIGVWVKGITSQQRLNPHLYTYLASINAFSMPLRPNREALIKLYCESIDRIFPILDHNQFIKLHNVGQAPTLLLHAVLLTAARHPQAGQHLGHQSVRQFCATTSAKIRTLLFAEVEQDRLTLMRIYALLSLHSEGPDGLENSCSDLQKAVHYATSLELHHERPFIDKEKLTNLWWALYCMDRINACVNARPLIINLADVGIGMVNESQHPILARMVKACLKLERVIYLYRPGQEYRDLPPEVDELFLGDDTFDPVNAVLALLHYIAVILAHKRISSATAPSEERVVSEVAGLSTSPRSFHNEHLNSVPNRPRVNNVNENYNDESITVGVMHTPLTMILAEERKRIRSKRDGSDEAVLFANFKKNFFSSDHFFGNEDENESYEKPQLSNDEQLERTDRILLSTAGTILRIIKSAKDLPPLPLLPYCTSLTLTVFLRTYPRHDTETGYSWKDGCTVLEAMADRWWVAGAMSSMGWNVFKSLEEKQQQSQTEGPTPAPAPSRARARAPAPMPMPMPKSLSLSQRQRQGKRLPFPYPQEESHQIYTRVQATQLAESDPRIKLRTPMQSSPPSSVRSQADMYSLAQSTVENRNSLFQKFINSRDNDDVIMADSGAMKTPSSSGSPFQSDLPMEERFLDMFSDFPNQTSFLDQAMTLDSLDGFEEWLKEKAIK